MYEPRKILQFAAIFVPKKQFSTPKRPNLPIWIGQHCFLEIAHYLIHYLLFKNVHNSLKIFFLKLFQFLDIFFCKISTFLTQQYWHFIVDEKFSFFKCLRLMCNFFHNLNSDTQRWNVLEKKISHFHHFSFKRNQIFAPKRHRNNIRFKLKVFLLTENII